jgi:subfamily B ATP-binding cassette protein MsbA
VISRSADILRWLFLEHGRRNARLYIAALILLGIGAAATAGVAWLLKPILNHMVDVEGFRRLRLLSLGVAALFAVRASSTYVATILLARAGNNIVANVQRVLFDRLLQADIGFLQERASSEFMSRLGLAAAGTRDALQVLVLSAGRDFLTLLGLVIVMFIHDPALALIVLTVLPVAAFWLSRLVRTVRLLARRSFEGSSRILAALQETVQGIRIVKSFNLEDVMRTRMGSAIADVERSANRAAARIAMASPMADLLAGLAIATVLYYGSWRVTVGSADAGSFFSFIVAFVLAYEPAKRLARVHLELQAALANARLVQTTLDEHLVSAAPSNPQQALHVGAGRIVYSDVWFAYRANEPVLRGLDLVFEPGRTTALVGASGAGKTTTIALLLRFYTPASGTITIDGQDIAKVDPASLRAAIAFVSQDVFLFRGTLRDNIAMGKPGATDAEIAAAARAARAHDFILRFARGYDTDVGELGTRLSGGERQRIAIARAMLKNAPILVLDEPTSSLDDESERAVRSALDTLRRGRTTIVIAHRRETIVAADAICALDAGRACLAPVLASADGVA